MQWIGFLLFILIIVSSVSAWINSKIILEDLAKIKKQLGIEEAERVRLTEIKTTINREDYDKKL